MSKRPIPHLLVVPACLLILVTVCLLGGEVKVTPDQRYLLLAANKADTMQEELDQATALGFCVRRATGMSEIAFFLERASPNETCKYLLIATNKSSTLEQELNEAAEENYRFVENTLSVHQGGFRREIVALMQQLPPERSAVYSYVLKAATRTGTLQAEVTDSVKDGFRLVDLVTFDEHFALLEKED